MNKKEIRRNVEELYKDWHGTSAISTLKFGPRNLVDALVDYIVKREKKTLKAGFDEGFFVFCKKKKPEKLKNFSNSLGDKDLATAHKELSKTKLKRFKDFEIKYKPDWMIIRDTFNYLAQQIENIENKK